MISLHGLAARCGRVLALAAAGAVMAAADVTAAEGLRIAAGTALPPMTIEGGLQMKSWPRSISWTAAPGQFEPGVIVIESSRDLKGLRVEAGDLKGEGGSVINGGCFRLHRVRMRGVKRKKDGAVVVYPEFLFPWEGRIDVKAAEPSFVWLTLAVPKDAAAGRYTGEIRAVSPGGTLPVKVELTVLPFKPVKPTIVLSMLYTYEFRYLERYERDFEPAGKRRDPAGRKAFLARGRRAVRDMAEHGMNTIFPHSGSEVIERKGRPFLPDLYESMDAARERGMDFPPGWVVGWLTHAQWKDIPKFDEKKDVALLKRIAAEAARAARERGFKDVIVVPSDEPNHERKLPVARKLLAGAGRIEGVRWAVTALAPALKDLSDLYDIAIIAGGTPEDWAEIRKLGKELWIYDNNATSGRDPLWSRFVYGLHGWRAGFDGVTSWTYPPDIGDYRGGRTDARRGPKIPCYTKDGLPVATVVWEAIREGIDDRRYIDTLEAEIAAARRGSRRQRRAARKGQEFLDELRKRVDPDLKAHHWEHTEYGAPRPRGFDWAGMEKVRADIIALVLELKALSPRR